MILGAGIYQAPLIRKASEMGLLTIVVSIPGPYPGFALADRPYEINTTDAEAVLEAARAEQIDGIVTTGTDVAVRTVGRVCAALGLPGIPEEAARVVTDKARMKEAFSGIVSSSPFRVLQLSADLTEDVSRRAAEAASELAEDFRPGTGRRLSDGEVADRIRRIGEMYRTTAEEIRKYEEG